MTAASDAYRHGDVVFSEPLGSGVFVGVGRGKHGRFAPRAICIDDADLEEYSKEVLSLRLSLHSLILPLQSVFVRGNFIYELYPYCDLGQANRVMYEFYPTGLPEKAIGVMSRAVLQALEYLHSRRVVHRSVRAASIVLDRTNGVKLAGMRHARAIPSTSDRIFELEDELAERLLWSAPEVLAQDLCGYSTISDVYSLGTAIVEMANGFPPFADMGSLQMLNAKLIGTCPRLLDSTTIPDNDDAVRCKRSFSTQMHDFVDHCLRDAKTRPSASSLRLHPFISKASRKSIREVLPDARPLQESYFLPAEDDPMVGGDHVECAPWKF